MGGLLKPHQLLRWGFERVVEALRCFAGRDLVQPTLHHDDRHPDARYGANQIRRSELRYEESRVFSVPMPEDNLFAALGVPGLPDGAFLLGPAVDAGYYVTLRLRPGVHTLHIQGVIEAADPAQSTVVDVTYQLTVERGRGHGHHGG